MDGCCGSSRLRARLLKHWQDERHPYAQRFAETYRPWVEKVLEAKEEANDALDEELSRHGLSLRVVVREPPCVRQFLLKTLALEQARQRLELRWQRAFASATPL